MSKKKHHHGGGVADLVELERLQIEEDVQRLRRRTRAALRDHEDDVEHLQRIDGADDRDDDEGAAAAA